MKLPIGKIICGDCEKILPKFPDNSIDLIVLDPPYNFGKEFKNDDLDEQDWEIFLRRISKKLYRIMKSNSFLLLDYPRPKLPILFSLFQEFDFYDFVAAFVINSMANCAFGMDRLTPSFVFKKGNPKIKSKYSNVVQVTRTSYGKDWTGHPTQKYLKAYYTYIRMLTSEQDIILDPCCGSGTALVAAEQLGRRWIGIDISEKYCKMSRKRIAYEKRNPGLRIFK